MAAFVTVWPGLVSDYLVVTCTKVGVVTHMYKHTSFSKHIYFLTTYGYRCIPESMVFHYESAKYKPQAMQDYQFHILQ